MCYNLIRAGKSCCADRRCTMWSITKIPIAAENGKALETYGICCGDTVVNDVSLRENEIETFVEKLNLFGASEIHAFDLVENFLGG